MFEDEQNLQAPGGLQILFVLKHGSVTNSRRNESGWQSHVGLKFMLGISESEMIPQATSVGLDSPRSSSYSAFAGIAPGVGALRGLPWLQETAVLGTKLRR